MKRKLLPLAIGAAVAVQAGVVLADATVYGKVNVTAQTQDESYLTNNVGANNGQKKDNWEFNSNASRLGFKGKAKISDDTDAIFKLEYEACVDDGLCSNGREFSQRNIVGGLSSKKFGTIQGGKHDTPLKLAADGTDQFNDLVYGDVTNYMVGENREDNIIMYNTPSMGGVTVTLATMVGEEDGVDENKNTATGDGDTQDDGLFDRTSVAVKYAPVESAWVALSADQNVKNADILRLNGSASFGDFTLGAHIQQAEVNNDNLDEDGTKEEVGEGLGGSSGLGGLLKTSMDGTADTTALPGADNADWHKAIEEQDAWMLSGKYQIGDWAIKAQYGESESTTFDLAGLAGEDQQFDAQQVALGVDYALSKNVIIFAYVAQVDVEIDNRVDFDGDASNTDENDGEFNTGGVGFEVKF